ncbi:Aminolevulinate dehydratase [Oleoguttula sp. CCFEE 5521]
MSFPTLVSDLTFRNGNTRPQRPSPHSGLSTTTNTTHNDTRSQISRAKSYASTAATSVSTAGDISSQLLGGYSHPLPRSWQAERQLTKSMLIYPVFITDNPDDDELIPSLPGQKRVGLNKVVPLLQPLIAKGLKSVVLFGVPLDPSIKDTLGTAADDPQGPVIQGIRLLRRSFPHLFIVTDVCLCECTSHGHCGILHEDGSLNNALSVERISDIAMAYAEAGAHCVAPSDMNDGRIRAIKLKLIESQISHRVVLMSYSAKFSGCLFCALLRRQEALPAPTWWPSLARRAIQRDIGEGADIIMVMPASQYLDIISDAKELGKDMPVAAYQVSREYAMIHAAAKAGVFDLKIMAFESTEGILRTGANIAISHFTPEFLDLLET